MDRQKEGRREEGSVGKKQKETKSIRERGEEIEKENQRRMEGQ